MPRVPLSLRIPDLSLFARAVVRELGAREASRIGPPGHLETLNLLARALGHRNVQTLQACLRDGPAPPAHQEDDDGAAAAATTPSTPPPLSANARNALGHFDRQGRLMRWPHKLTVQRMAMWVLWTRFDAKRLYSEKEVNAILKEANGFADHVILRRELVNHRLMARKSDCSTYWKLAVRPDDETRALLTACRSRARDEPPAFVR